MTPYQFSLLRYTHKISRGEFANFGLVMWVPDSRKLLMRIDERYKALSGFFRDFEGERYRKMVRAIQSTVLGAAAEIEDPQSEMFQELPRGLQDLLSRILPPSDAGFSRSETMAGVTKDAEARFEQLFAELVAHQPDEARSRVDEEQLREGIDKSLSSAGLARDLRHDYTLKKGEFSYSFARAWENGKLQLLEPISFDLEDRRTILDKACRWSGRLDLLQGAADFSLTAVVAPPARGELEKAFGEAVKFLKSREDVRQVLTSETFESIIPKIRADLRRKDS